MGHRRTVIKIGSNVLTRQDGTLDLDTMASIVNQTAELHCRGFEIILVSSGAVASGRSEIAAKKKLDAVSARQLYSAIGQAKLINSYYELFREHGIVCGQVLTTKESLSTRKDYLNQRNCINVMLENGVIPIINENDTISVTELMFTDNDELSGLVATMMDAESLVILSNVDGIYNGLPGQPGTSVIPEIHPSEDLSGYVKSGKSSFGRGGMLTKCKIAGKVADEGIEVIIANGKRPDILLHINENDGKRDAEPVYTRFIPSEKPISHVKKWIAHSESYAKGGLQINKGAYEALCAPEATSLLPVGVVAVTGEFEKDDIVRIIAPDGRTAGVGKVTASSKEAAAMAGKKGCRPLIHYDYLYLDIL